MDGIGSEQAAAALEAARRAQRQVAREVGLPRWYWWAMAGGWVALGVIGDFAPGWAAAVATLVFGAGHATIASRLLDGRRRTDQVQVSAQVAGRRTPLVVIAMLLGLVALTIVAALALDADGVAHPRTWSGILVAAVIGFGGPEMLRVLRGRVRA